MCPNFELVSSFTPCGDQPQAIEKLTAGLQNNKKYQTLLGVTGSGKTFTMANVIRNYGKPTLVISHNKTLAAQLYSEFKSFFPNNSVHYFVSYYDYYQPEAYIPQRDIYIEKDASINENLEKLRLASTSALLTRKDVIIVASVSCIYGIGSPEDFMEVSLSVKIKEQIKRDDILKRLVEMQYERNNWDLKRGSFRIRADTIEVFPAYADFAVRIRLSDNDEIEEIILFDPLSMKCKENLKNFIIFPAKHFIVPQSRIESAIVKIKEELKERLKFFRKEGRLIEAQRLEARTNYDIEMLREIGYCKGIENYSRHLSGRLPGQRPYTLVDYFPKDALVIIDESHVTIPQLQGMYYGDRSRKLNLIEYGFRLPSALDNRPMKFEEFLETVDKIIFVSATPREFEIEMSGGISAEQIIRPTGLVDPLIEVHPAKEQIADLIEEIKVRIKQKERVLITTLTKRLAEELANYLQENQFKAKYLHSELDAIERARLLKELREGKIDIIVGINLLREGLDLPEVSLVAILDADKEGFLRSNISLIQTMGRTARNVNGKVILYADELTESMKAAIAETTRRRNIQMEYNKIHGITPKTIQKELKSGIEELLEAEEFVRELISLDKKDYSTNELIYNLEKQMYEFAEQLEFEKAAEIRDYILELKQKQKSKYAKRKVS